MPTLERFDLKEKPELNLSALVSPKIETKGAAWYFPQALKETGKEIAQSIARSFLATGATIEEVSRQTDPNIFNAFRKAIKTAQFKPETGYEKALAGTTEPVSFESIGLEALRIGGEDFAQKHQNLAMPVGLLIAGLDVTPWGGSEKNLFKAMVKTKTVGEALSLLAKAGVADDLARQFASDVVKVADEKSAKVLFENIANLQKTTKVAKPAVPAIPKESIARQLVKDQRSLEELTQKAADSETKQIFAKS